MVATKESLEQAGKRESIKMVRTRCCDKNGLKKGTWTPEEDRKLMAYVSRYGCWNWRQLPKYAGLQRCGKSCRLRWMNYLRPNIKRGNYTKEEEETILRLHESLGNRWSVIASQLPGRTDNEIKNHWHTKLKKSMQKDSLSKQQKLNLRDNGKNQEEEDTKANNSHPIHLGTPQIMELGSLLYPKPSSSSSDISSNAGDNSIALISSSDSKSDDEFAFFEEVSGNFWTEPFVSDNYCMPNESLNPLLDPLSPLLDDEIFACYSLFEPFGGWN